ncbi:MAG: hypothetical protein ACKVQC_07560 [Elusimicrobiota bacterium]
MKSESIQKIKNKFHKEWLLISVDKVDYTTTTPLTGKLISHSPHRSEIYSALKKKNISKKILLEYSEDDMPKGYIAAF